MFIRTKFGFRDTFFVVKNGQSECVFVRRIHIRPGGASPEVFYNDELIPEYYALTKREALVTLHAWHLQRVSDLAEDIHALPAEENSSHSKKRMQYLSQRLEELKKNASKKSDEEILRDLELVLNENPYQE